MFCDVTSVVWECETIDIYRKIVFSAVITVQTTQGTNTVNEIKNTHLCMCAHTQETY